MAIVLPFVEVPSRRARGAAFYSVDRVSAPVQVVPLLSLGCRVDVRSCAADAAASEIQYYISQLQADAGGLPLQSKHAPVMGHVRGECDEGGRCWAPPEQDEGEAACG